MTCETSVKNATRASRHPASSPLIRIDDLSAGFESQTVFQGISFDIPRLGIVAVMGPAGVGKSTLLRTLGRWNEGHPSFWAHGNVYLGDRDLLRDEPIDAVQRSIPLLAQKARLYTATILDNAIAEVRPQVPLTRDQKYELAQQILEPHGLWSELLPALDESVLSLSIGRQRMLSVARLTAGPSVCLLADEALRDLTPEDSRDLESLLRRLSERHAIVMVTHNQGEARRMADSICLVTAGRLIEATAAEEFFVEPRTALGREFLRSGNCWPAAVESSSRTQTTVREWSPTPVERAVQPGGFHWIIRGALGGMQWPGLLRDEESELDALAALGVAVLVSLTEEAFDAEKLERVGVAAEHFPIPDMGVPDFDAAVALCRRISEWIDAGEPVVLHCKAGLGRTGSILACTLVYRGADAIQAIHQVRCTNSRYIQSEEQLAFVGEFADRLAKLRV